MPAFGTASVQRNVYVAVSTPEYADFPHVQPGPSSLSHSQPYYPNTPRTMTLDEDLDDLGGFELDPPIPSSRETKSWSRQKSRALWEVREKILDFFRRNTGLLLVAAAQMFLSLMNVAVKKLNSIDPPVPTLELVFVRMIITYICCMAYMLATGVPDPFLGPKGVRILLFTRGFVGFFGLFGVYYSLNYLSLSDATVLTFLSPMCTAIAGALLLGEKFTKREAFAGLVSLVGVILIARPTALFGPHVYTSSASMTGTESITIDGGSVGLPVGLEAAEKGTPQERLVAVGVALIGVLGATGAYTTIRAIGKRAHPLHSMTFFSALCVLISTTGMTVKKTPIVIPTRLDWMSLLIMIGIFGFIAQTLLTMGLQRETAGRGSMAVYTQIVFATILERIFFHAVPTALSVIGTLLIVSSALYVALTKEKETEGEKVVTVIPMGVTNPSSTKITDLRVSGKPLKKSMKALGASNGYGIIRGREHGHGVQVETEMEEGLLSRMLESQDEDGGLGLDTRMNDVKDGGKHVHFDSGA